MDTNDLTEMAYDCIRFANDASDFLKSELGAACSRFKTEEDYLQGIHKYVKTIEARPRAYLDSRNLLDDVDLPTFKQKLKILREHIEKTIATPLKDRGEPGW